MKRSPVFHIAMIMYSMIYFVPLLWMALSALKTNQEITQNPLSLPSSWDFSVFIEAFTVGNLGKYALNSAIITGTCTCAVLFFGSMAAFAFTRLKFRFSNQILALITLGLILPIQSYFIAQNALFDILGIKDTRLALILPYTAMGLPLAIWLFRAYIQNLPKEVFEAARVDGAGDLRVYQTILVPMLKPGLATVAVFTALSAWNEFLLALVYIQNDNLKTIPTGLLTFSTRYSTNYHLLFAALTIVTIPMIIVYIIFNRKVIEGLTEGAVK
jgi:raffinose/stachyose/melibiose transport system permease protein